MTIDMRKLHESSYDEIESYCQELAWRGLINQGQLHTYPNDLNSAVRAIIDMAARWAVAKEEKRRSA